MSVPQLEREPAARPASPANSTRRSRRVARPLRRALAFVLALALADQLVQHVLLRDGELLGRRIAPFDPPLFCDEQRRSLASLRRGLELGMPSANHDAELGWCHRPDALDGPDPIEGGERYDWAGCRVGVAPLARERRAGERRVVAVGESFTYGSEVAAGDTWIARLDRARADLEIANLGVGGFGLDQALLRLRRDGFPLRPDEVWLGLVPETAIRATTVYVPALRHWFSTPAFKPRFLLDDAGELALVPNPAPTPSAVSELLSSQRRFLDAVRGRDVWVDRFPSAYDEHGASLWHHSGLARVWVTWLERAERAPAPWFEQGGRELERLVLAIVRRARDDCAARSASLRVVLLPARGDLQFARETGREYWSGLVAALRAEHVEVLEPRAALERAGGDLESALWAPLGHYSVEGNRVVAEAVLGMLEG